MGQVHRGGLVPFLGLKGKRSLEERKRNINSLAKLNSERLRSLLREPPAQFWKEILRNRNEGFSIAGFFALSKFEDLRLIDGEECESIMELISKLICRIFCPENLIENVTFIEWTNKHWESDTKARVLMNSHTIFGMVRALYASLSTRHVISMITENVMKIKKIESVIFEEPLSMIFRLIVFLNNNFHDSYDSIINSLNSSKPITFAISFGSNQSNSNNADIKFDQCLLRVLSEGLKDFAILMEADFSACRYFHAKHDFFQNLSLVYKNVNMNLFQDPRHYMRVDTVPDLSDTIYRKSVRIMKEFPFYPKNWATTTQTVLLGLKCSILSFTESYIGRKYNYFAETFTEKQPHQGISVEADEHNRTTKYYSEEMARTALKEICLIIRKLENIEKAWKSDNTLKYKYLTNAPLVSDIEIRLDLTTRLKENTSLQVFEEMDTIQSLLEILSEIRDHTIIPSTSNHNDKRIYSSFLKQINEAVPSIDAILASCYCSIFDYNINDAISHIFLSLGKTNKQTILKYLETSELYAVMEKDGNLPKDAFGKGSIDDSLRQKTLDLEEAIIESDIANDASFAEYNEMVSGNSELSRNENILLDYYTRNSAVFSRSARGTNERLELARKTKLDDNKLEGWYRIIERCPAKSRITAAFGDQSLKNTPSRSSFNP